METTTQNNIAPFSSGSEAMFWYGENCEKCTKAFFPKKQGDWPSDKTMRQYCSTGKECKLKYAIDVSFITAELPLNIALQVGYKEETEEFPDSCMMFSDNDDDRWQPPKRLRPDKTPQNQMVMPFLFDSITQELVVR